MAEADYHENLDHYAEEYLTPNTSRVVDQKILSMLVDKLGNYLEGPNVLEMGHGDGVWTKQIIERFGKSYLIEASSQLIETAKASYGDKLTVYQSYFEDFRSPVSFDSIICTYVLEHVINPVLVLRQCRNWLKLNGLLLVVVPNATSIHRRLGVIMGIQKDVYHLGESDLSVGHRRVYDAERLEAELVTAGFRIETSLPMMFKPLPNSLLAYLNEAQLKGLFDLGNEIPVDYRSILVYLCRPIHVTI